VPDGKNRPLPLGVHRVERLSEVAWAARRRQGEFHWRAREFHKFSVSGTYGASVAIDNIRSALRRSEVAQAARRRQDEFHWRAREFHKFSVSGTYGASVAIDNIRSALRRTNPQGGFDSICGN